MRREKATHRVAGGRLDRFDRLLFGGKRQPHAVAMARMLVGLATVGILAVNFAHRGVLAGAGSAWVDDLRALSRFPDVAFLSGVSDDVLTAGYFITLASAVAFTLGWRAKVANIVLLAGFVAVMGQNPLTTSPIDHLIRLTLLWMLLMDTSQRWSLDARRRVRGRRARRPRSVMAGWLSGSLHNIGLIGLALQVVMLYAAAGLDKLAHPRWRDGTALAYTLRLPENRAFESVADVFVSVTVLGALLTYAVMLSQVCFGPLLLHRRTRVPAVAFVVAVNLVVAVVFATPAESLVLIAVTLIFLPDDELGAQVEAAGSTLRTRAGRRRAGAGPGPPPPRGERARRRAS